MGLALAPAKGASRSAEMSCRVSSRHHVVDDRFGCQERGFYIHFGGVEQVRVGGRLQRRFGAAHVARVAALDVGEDFGEIGLAAIASISSSRRLARTAALAVT